MVFIEKEYVSVRILLVTSLMIIKSNRKGTVVLHVTQGCFSHLYQHLFFQGF